MGNKKLKKYNEAIKKGKEKGTPLKVIPRRGSFTPYPGTNILPIEAGAASPTGTQYGSEDSDLELWASYAKWKKPQQEVKVKPTTTKQTAKPKSGYWTEKDVPAANWKKFIKQHQGAIGMDPNRTDENGYHLPIYKDKPKDRKPVTSVVNNLKPAGLVSDDLEIDSTNFPELRPQVKPVKDWKYIWKHAGTTQWGHVNSPEDMDKWVDWRDWYSTGGGKDKGDSVEIIPVYQMGGQAPKRRGVRYNEDGSVSTHLMKTETDGKGNWFSFPTLFQNSIPYADDSENWLDMSDRPWEEAYEEAKKRGEVRNFGSDKDAAIKFGQGSWKDKKQMGGNIYPVNYVPEAQMGASIPGAVGFSYARTQSPAPDNGPGARRQWLVQKMVHG